MKLFSEKYRNKFAALMLLSYLFLVGLSIFHYHHIDIQTGHFEFADGNCNSTANPFDKLVDLTHTCVVQQFASTVLNYSFISIFDSIKINFIENISFSLKQNYPFAPHYNNNRHRAPPVLA